MTTYNTMNPVPSADARDRYDNSQVFDELMNGAAPNTPDRLGVLRQSYAGMEHDFKLMMEGFGLSRAGDYAAGLVITSHQQYVEVGGQAYVLKAATVVPYTVTGDWATESVNFKLAGDSVLRQELAGVNGAKLVYDGGVSVADMLLKLRSQILVLDAKTDGTDQTSVVTAFFASALAAGKTWVVPPGNYTINPTAPIAIRTSGTCAGTFLVPKSNQTFWFDIERDEAGTVISAAGWISAPKRGQTDVGALNAVGKNLFINSTEILMERFGAGGPYTPYYKQEFIRCPMPNGAFSTAIVRDYNNVANMTVTAHTPSKPITVTGLAVLLTGASGGVESNRGSIVVMRDNVVLDSPWVHNENPGQPRPVAIEASYCADVTINNPDVLGFNYDGLGYGILSGTSIGLTINGGNVQDCRHAYTDAFTVDVTINGGSWSRVIDSHWCDRFTANDCSVYAVPGSSAFSMAGDDVTLNRIKQFGGRNTLGIRTDTPQLGGQVRVIAPEISAMGISSGEFYVFGFTSPGGTGPIVGTYTQKPRLPDHVEISDVVFRSDAPILYGAYLGVLEAIHTTWGTVRISGVWTASGQTILGIFAQKNSNYQKDRSPLLLAEASIDCGANGSIVYAAALDGVTTGAMNVRVRNLVRGSLRFSGYSVNILKVTDSSVLSIVDDNSAAASIGVSAFNDVLMLGGSVSATLKNLSFQGSQFVGNYAEFPLAANVTMVGNIKGVSVTGLPADIRNNVVAPYN